ncbi:DUF2590 family protein [Salmonella enterica subsp. enterica]|nr:DUF2590 family protein [Salmonella enterica subsp. enterica]
MLNIAVMNLNYVITVKSIGRDFIHSIIESGLATELVPKGSPDHAGEYFYPCMELLIEDIDERIVREQWKSVKKAGGHGCGSRPAHDFGGISVQVDL